MIRREAPSGRELLAAVCARTAAEYRGVTWDAVSAYIYRAEYRGHDGVNTDGVLVCRLQAELSELGGRCRTVCSPRALTVEIPADAAPDVPPRIERIVRAVRGGEAVRVRRTKYARLAAVIFRSSGWTVEAVTPDGRRRDILQTDEVRFADDPSDTAPRFMPPSVAEVELYCTERGNTVSAEAFVAFYEAKGWRIGKEKMKDWRAAVRTWEQRSRADAPAASHTGSFDTDDFFGAAVRRSYGG